MIQSDYKRSGLIISRLNCSTRSTSTSGSRQIQQIVTPSAGQNPSLLRMKWLGTGSRAVVERKEELSFSSHSSCLTGSTSWDSKDLSCWNVPERDTESSNFTVVALQLTLGASEQRVSSSGINSLPLKINHIKTINTHTALYCWDEIIGGNWLN